MALWGARLCAEGVSAADVLGEATPQDRVRAGWRRQGPGAAGGADCRGQQQGMWGVTDTLCAEGCGEDGDPTHEATRRAAQKEGGFCCLQMLQQKISKEEIIALCIHTEYR